MPIDKARECGATGILKANMVKLLKSILLVMGKRNVRRTSRSNTADLGHFKILKEESSSAGVRRIKAILD